MEGGNTVWSYPSRGNCLGCHNQDRALGLEVDQLDFDADLAGNVRPTSTLSRWRQAGLVDGDVPAIPRLPRVDGKAALERRARAYLHANCSICHAPGGPTPVDMDLRFATALSAARVCGVAPAEGDLGVAGARRLLPGDSSHSLLALRMRAHGRAHMPPIGPQQVDDKGAALVEAWIRGLPACP
jgi:mono/diheme cytochrome c family protein